MYRSLNISSFRAHSRIAFPELGRINLLTGLNDAGKTSVLEAIFLNANGPFAGQAAFATLRASRSQDELSLGPDGENPWASLFHGFNMSNPVLIEANTSKGFNSVKLSEASQNIQTPALQVGAEISSTSHIQVTHKQGDTETIHDQALKVTTSQVGPNSTLNIELSLTPAAPSSFCTAHFFKPGKLHGNLAEGFSEMRKSRQDTVLSNALKLVDARISGLEVLYSNGSPQLHAVYEDQSIPFYLLGDGPNAVAQYVVALFRAKGGVMLIDEVGNGIHHSALPDMWRALNGASKRFEVQIFATTHSQETLLAAHAAVSENNALHVHRLRHAKFEGEDTRVSTYYGGILKEALEMNTDLR